MQPRNRSLLTFTVVALATPAFADTVVTFDNGAEGWVGPSGGGGTTIDQTDGNPGANMHTVVLGNGVTFRNNANPEFVRDYSVLDSFTLAVDLEVVSIAPFEGGQQVFRPWVVELRDYDNPPEGYPYVSVFYEFSWVNQSDWTTWSITVDDPSSIELPEGWGGSGDENENFEPILPADRTFTDVLAGVDEIVFTTLEPGWFFTSDNYDMRLDNITIETNQLSFGLVNRPLGGAVLSDDGEGRLVISNISESGKDGFVVRVGDAERIDIETQEQDATLLGDGDWFNLTAAGTVDGVSNVDVGTLRAEVTDGEFLLTPDDSDIGAASYTMRLEAADGTVVYEEPGRTGPAVRLARWTLFYRKKYPDGTIEWCIGRREAQAMTVAGGGTFDAAMVTMRAEAPITPVEWVNDLQVRPRGVPQLVVFNQGLGLNGLGHTGLGSGRLEGVDGQLVIDSIGDSGLDGVSGSAPRASRVEIGVLEQDAVQLDAGAGFAFTSRGEAGDASDVEIGTLRAEVTGGDFLLTPDDSAIGAESYTLQLRDAEGTLLYEEAGRAGPAVAARRFSLFYRVKYPDGTVEWCIGGSPQAMRIVDGPTFDAAMVMMRAEVPEGLAPGTGAFTPVDAIIGMDIKGRSVPGITITSEVVEPITCAADLDGDNVVAVSDLLYVLSAWGSCPGCPEDLDGDGEVAVSDLLVVLAAWGDCD